MEFCCSCVLLEKFLLQRGFVWTLNPGWMHTDTDMEIILSSYLIEKKK